MEETFDIYNILALIGGLAMFLFGMNLMSTALEKSAGNRLKKILSKMTSNPIKGFLLGLFVTLIVQSSSATTVMVVGFVNSGVMTIQQSIGVIMGANLGASVTSWIISLQEIQGTGILAIFKPETFVPVLALLGAVMYIFQKNAKRKDMGLILLGFSVLMFGMENMSGAVKPLGNNEAFTSLLVLFQNPFMGVLVGTIFTAIIQSSGASVGILQALTTTGAITYSTVVPVVMGQNIGTCITAMLSSIGANKNARRAAVIHLAFNVIATLIILPVFYLVDHFVDFAFMTATADYVGVAVVHTVFKLIALAILMPASKLLEKLAEIIVPDKSENDEESLLDERLFATPAVAIDRCRMVEINMAEIAVQGIYKSLEAIKNYTPQLAESIRKKESKVDQYEDKIGTYLVKLSAQSMTEADSTEATKLLHLLGDFERISDHSVNIIESVEEIIDKELSFSDEAKEELDVIVEAIKEILDLALKAVENNDLEAAVKVEPLEQVIDGLRDTLKKRHISRLQKKECTIEVGFVLTDLLTNLERISDHCSNIAGCILEMDHDDLGIHQYLKSVKKGEPEFNKLYQEFKDKYSIDFATAEKE